MNQHLTHLLTYIIYHYYTPYSILFINLVNPLFKSYEQFFCFGWFAHCSQKRGSKVHSLLKMGVQIQFIGVQLVQNFSGAGPDVQ